MTIILASQSPRRLELLQKITTDFTVLPSNADETIPAGTLPTVAVELLAAKKAEQIYLEHPDCCVIGADTVVAVDRRILGKPHSRPEALEMLALLSGRTHSVHTGVAVLLPGGLRRCWLTTTHVEFYHLTPTEMEAYADTDEPYDKAGGYGIQGRGGLLVRSVCGDYDNVVGLPTGALWRVLRELNVL